MSKRTVVLHEMTRTAFEEYLATHPIPVAIIALGSIEQHGPHLPLGTDALCGLEFARLTAEKAGAVVVLPCLPGYSPHHMGFKGTITFSEETLVSVLNDTVESLTRHGIRKIMICNAHGGNDEIVAYVARTAGRRHNCKVLPAPALPPGDVHRGPRSAWPCDLMQDVARPNRPPLLRRRCAPTYWVANSGMSGRLKAESGVGLPGIRTDTIG